MLPGRVVGEARRVHVTVQLTATNHLKDTATRRYYCDRAALAADPDSRFARLLTTGMDEVLT